MEALDRKIFATLFVSIFAAVTGVGIVVPLLPVYAHDLGASGMYIGMIFGAFSLSRTLFLPHFGRQSDKKGRKPFIVAGLLGYTLVSAAFCLSSNVHTLILIRFAQGIASAMIMPAAQAYVGDITPTGKEGFTMGLFNISVFWGLSIGPLAGGIINSRYGLNAAFGCMGLLAFLGFGLSLFMLPPRTAEQALSPRRPPILWRRLLEDREVCALFIFRLAYTTGIGIVWGFLPVLADTEFSLASSSIGVLLMLGVFTSGLIQAPMGMLADRISKPLMVAAGGLIVSLAVLSFHWAHGFMDLFMANLLFGLGGGIAMPALMGMAVQKGNRADAMGSLMALLIMAHSTGMLFGSVLGGLAMDLFSLKQAFSLGALVMLCGTAFFCMSVRSRSKRSAAG